LSFSFYVCVVLVVVASVAGNVHFESGINGHLGNAYDTPEKGAVSLITLMQIVCCVVKSLKLPL